MLQLLVMQGVVKRNGVALGKVYLARGKACGVFSKHRGIGRHRRRLRADATVSVRRRPRSERQAGLGESYYDGHCCRETTSRREETAESLISSAASTGRGPRDR